MHHNCRKHIKVIALVFLFSLLTGCASSARYSQMTVGVDEVNLAAKKNTVLVKNIAVEKLSGGKKTNPLWTSQVDDQGFSKALGDSLSNVGYLNSDLSSARYQLAVSLEELTQPMLGLDMKVTCKTKYELYDKKLKKAVFEKTLITPYTASFSSAFMGAERLKLANEGAVKENIKHLIQELNTLKIVQ